MLFAKDQHQHQVVSQWPESKGWQYWDAISNLDLNFSQPSLGNVFVKLYLSVAHMKIDQDYAVSMEVEQSTTAIKRTL